MFAPRRSTVRNRFDLDGKPTTLYTHEGVDVSHTDIVRASGLTQINNKLIDIWGM